MACYAIIQKYVDALNQASDKSIPSANLIQVIIFCMQERLFRNLLRINTNLKKRLFPFTTHSKRYFRNYQIP